MGSKKPENRSDKKKGVVGRYAYAPGPLSWLKAKKKKRCLFAQTRKLNLGSVS